MTLPEIVRMVQMIESSRSQMDALPSKFIYMSAELYEILKEELVWMTPPKGDWKLTHFLGFVIKITDAFPTSTTIGLTHAEIPELAPHVHG
jgi:hypothetical protein